MFRKTLALSVLALLPLASINAQSVRLPAETDGDEVIVQALRIPRERLPTGVYWDINRQVEQRIAREQKQVFFQCALKFAKPITLRRIADGDTYSLMMRGAQGSLVVQARGCFPGLPERSGGTITPLNLVDYGSSAYDRGMIVEMILRRDAPDAALTRADTQDPAVQERYRLREYSRNGLRLPNDRNAWLLMTCLVRDQPVLATRLVRSAPGSQLERGLIQAMLVEGRGCVGETKRVTINPEVFRPYLVDAFYRWVVASRNVASLVEPA